MPIDLEPIYEALNRLQTAATSFRDLINHPRRHHILFARRKDFDLLCSAMDFIDDTIYALHAYFEHTHSDQGLAYLEILGVLQAITIQQDAFRKQHKIIMGEEIDLTHKNSKIKSAREIITRVAGHPVGGLGTSHFIVRHSVSKWGFDLWEFDGGSDHKKRRINLIDLILGHISELTSELQKVITHMKSEDDHHKRGFISDPLAGLFQNSTYFCSKIAEGIHRHPEMGSIAIESIRDAVEKFRDKLVARSAHFKESDVVQHELPNIFYALDKLNSFFKEAASMNKQDAEILQVFIRTKIKLLADIAREIDEEYRVDS